MKLFLDACSIIYLIESHQDQGQRSRFLINQALQADTQLALSRLSFLECRVMPLKSKNTELLDCYDRFFRLPSLEIVELDAIVVEVATELRAKYPSSLRTPDAIQELKVTVV
jgi:predicted nucleic acid-binding protein